MQKKMLVIVFAIVASIGLVSCATNRDCNGVKHTRLSNGVRI